MEVCMSRKTNKKFSKKDDKDSKLNESRNPGENKDDLKDDKSSETKATVRKGMSPGNDPAWYGLFPSLLRDSSSLMYSDPLGSRLFLMSRGNWTGSATSMFLRDNGGTRKSLSINDKKGIDDKAHNVPGVCALYLQNTMGFSSKREDPINQMANQIYTQVRYVNSGRKNYDPCDLVMYIHAVIECYAFVYWCRRLYNEAFVYSQTNTYIGRGLLEAEFVDPEDLKANLNDFRAWLNTLILNVSSYCIPSNIPYIAKKVFQYSGIYIENAFGNIKDQMYMFCPASFLTFALDELSAGKLTPIPVDVYNKDPTPGLANPAGRTNKLKVSDIMKLGNFMLNQIILDEDFSLMSGDILKAFQGSVATLDAVGEEGGIVPIYDPYVLSQFKNATIVSNLNRANDNTWIDLGHGHKAGEIWQDSEGIIQSRNYIAFGTTQTTNWVDNNIISLCMAKVLTVENPAPGPADNIEASRLMVMGTFNDAASHSYKVICGTEIVVDALFISKNNSGWVKNWFQTNFSTIGDYLGNAGVAVGSTAIIRSFKYAPTAILGVADAEGTKIEDLIILQNVDQYTVVGIEEIEKMHRCALFSLLFVPTVAKNFNNA